MNIGRGFDVSDQDLAYQLKQLKMQNAQKEI